MSRAIFSGQRIPRELLVLPTEEYYRRRYRSSNRGRWLLFLVTALAVFVAAMGARAQQLPAVAGQGETVTLNDVKAGDLLFRIGLRGQYVPSVHLASHAKVSVRGLVAEVRLEQEFINRTQQWQEAVYVLPLPEQAAVNGLEIQVGKRRIVGKVRERQEAAKIYRAARAAGKRAALLEQQRPNLFTNKVANIAPGETVRVHIRYLQPVNYDSGAFSLRLPTTLTPRYIPGDIIGAGVAGEGEAPLALNSEGWALPTDQVPDADKITPFMQPAAELDGLGSHRISIDVALDGGLPLANISSPYHDIDSSKTPSGGYAIALRGGSALMDRDFVLRWRPRASAMPRAALFTETKPAVAADANGDSVGQQDTYLQLLLLPPDAVGKVRRLPREVVYVIDTSGSMGGNSIRQAKESLLLALSRLQPGDRFNVIEFNSVTRAFFPRPVVADAQSIQHARTQVENLQASGGTEMAPALRLAFSQQLPGDESLVRQVIFITDGAVGNERALFELIHQSLADARLFTVGIGSAPNSHFMRKAAQFGRGTFVTIGDLSEVQERMQALFAKLENPLVTDLQLRWPQGLVVDAYPKRIPDLYRGEPLQLVAQIEGGQLHGKVELHGRLAGQQFQRELTLQSSSGDSGQGVGSVWARSKIDALRDRQLTTGENTEEGQSLRGQILQLALDHQLASPYTSFVAVEEKVVRPQGQGLSKSPVPNAVARGQILQRQTYPRTAAGIYAQLLSAAGLLGLGLLLRGRSALQRGRDTLRRGGGLRGRLSHRLREWLRRLLPDLRRARHPLETGLVRAR
ncbi:marine proteobacterial sortase target protein [Microbulbifer hainanensis]|uniref:marine proteobacterial sortase target protein n=1 Tax=Microbulbifer hainanensis TaxID=2735675 RepID=UPI0029C0E026|nr:marine proteobacterial sortase target protein [Microbulbifer hainanensis]